MSGLWGWVYESLAAFQRAAQQSDMDRGRLVRLYRDVLTEPLALLHSEPQQVSTLLAEGYAIAERLGEVGWMVLLDHWRARALRVAGDFWQARDIAMRAAVQCRKPPYDRYPQRFCIQIEDIVGLFMLIDPAGYADHIYEALDYAEVEITPDLECGWCLQMHRSAFAANLDHMDEAQEYALRAQSLTSGIGHREAQVYQRLCVLAARHEDWRTLEAWAIEGEAAARRSRRQALAVAFLAWRAVVARQGGDEQVARSLHRAATAQARPLGGIETGRGDYLGPLCLYYQVGGEFERALFIRERQIEQLTGQGLTYAECWHRLRQCRLLSQLGRSFAHELATLRAVAQGLSNPASFLQQAKDLEP